MRLRSCLKLGFVTLVASGCLTSPPAEEPQPMPLGPTSPPPLSPCERASAQRARVSELLATGRLSRAERVLAHADTLCPASSAESSAPREKVKAALSDARSGDELYRAGVAARVAGDRAEMQRMFDRAMVNLAEETKAPVTARVPSTRLPDVGSIAWSADGKLLASVSDRYVSIHESAADLRETRRLAGFADEVRAVAFAPDGKLLAVASADNGVRLFDTQTWRETKRLAHQPFKTPSGPYDSADALRAIAFSPDGTLLASATTDGGSTGNVRLWNVARGTEVRALEATGAAEGAGGHELAFDRSGKTLTAAWWIGTVSSGSQTWQVATGKLTKPEPRSTTESARVAEIIKRWPSPNASVERASVRALAPDGKLLAVDGKEGVSFVDAASGKTVRAGSARSQSYGYGYGRVVAAPDGVTIASAGDGLRLWSLGRKPSVRLLSPETSAAVALSRDGSRLAFAGSRATELWDPKTAQVVASREIAQASAVAFSPDGGTLAVGAYGHLTLLDLIHDRVARDISLPSQSLERVAFSPDGKLVAAGNVLLDAPSGTKKAELKSSPFTFAPEGDVLATGSTQQFQLLALKTNTESPPFVGAEDLQALAFSPNGVMVASAASTLGSGSIRLWQAGTQKKLLDIALPSSVTGVAFLPSGKVILGAHRSLSLWSLEGALLASVDAVAAGSAGYAFSADQAPWVEVLGPDTENARAALSCVAGDRVYPFELCRERFEVSGLLEAAMAGVVYADEP